ncbi:MAG: AAA family ATPase [Actinomycetota bacterium]
MRVPAHDHEGVDAATTPAPSGRASTARADAGVEVHLFGELDLRRGGAPLPTVGSPRARSLIGLVVLHRSGLPRPRLAFLLWPDSTESQARTNLRKLLHHLRRDCPEVADLVEVTAGSVRWRREVGAWVDVEAFEAAVSEASTVPGDPAPVAALRRAADIYTAELLEGCYDEWVVEDRQRLADCYGSVLRRLAPALAERGDHADAVRYGRELLRRDPVQEDAYRLLMRLHASAGDRAAAARVYHECVSTLQRELGVGPGPETVAQYEALMQSTAARTEAGPAPAAGALAPQPGPAGPALVGRAAEWAELTRLWEQAEGGRPSLVLVTGEAGIGKTRIVEELGAWCGHRGAVVASGRAYPTEGELGYGVAIDWLRCEVVYDQLARAGPADRADLGRLLPELHAGGPAGGTDEAGRARLFDGVARALGAIRRPILLVVDDAQWCDAASLQLAHYLLRRQPSLPLLVVATVRREDLDPDHPLGRLAAMDRMVEVTLGRLSPEEAARLADQLVPGALGREGAGVLHADTEGNPLFIVEAVRAGWRGVPGERPRVTPKVQALIGARLQRLSPAGQQMVGLAATVGREFTGGLLRAASGADEQTLVGALDELWRRGFVREQGTEGYDFSHGRIREVAYEALSPAVRSHNHIAVAEALQLADAQGHGSVSGQVAGHYDRGGQPLAAVTWYRRAAGLAQRRYAAPEAVRLLDRALELAAELPPDLRLEHEQQVLDALPAALVGIEGFSSARLAEVQDRALEVAAARGREPGTALLRSLVMSSLCRRSFDDARVAAARLAELAERAGDQSLAVEADYLLGITAFWTGRLTDARAGFERVVARFSADRRDEHLVRFGHDPAIVCLSRLGNTLWFLGDEQAARAAREESLAMAQALGHPYSAGAAYGFGALLALDLGETSRVAELVGAMARLPAGLPNGRLQAALAAYLDVVAGHPTEGTAGVRAVIGECGPVDVSPGMLACLMRVSVAAHVAAGDPKAAVAAVDEALGAGGSRLWEAELWRVRAEQLARAGSPPAEVTAQLDRAASVARARGAAGSLARLEATRSRVLDRA